MIMNSVNLVDVRNQGASSEYKGQMLNTFHVVKSRLCSIRHPRDAPSTKVNVNNAKFERVHIRAL